LGDIYKCMRGKVNMKIKKDLLEYLIRECISEVLTQVNEADDDTKGAPAPPADGQGTADQPAVPKEPTRPHENPSEPETPPSPELKGVVLVNPRDKSKLRSVPLRFTNDAALERDLHRLGATIAGTGVKTALSATRAVKDAIKNPNSPAYLYVGKYDPNSDELFLMADKSLQVAKDASVPPSELTGASVSPIVPSEYDPLVASAGDVAQRMTAAGQTPRPEIPEDPEDTEELNEGLKTAIKKMITEVFHK
jgi:hypothetical protein